MIQVEWPLSIVVSQQSMAQYQLIFRHLFELKYVEQQLNSVWQTLQSTRRLYRSEYSHPNWLVAYIGFRNKPLECKDSSRIYCLAALTCSLK